MKRSMLVVCLVASVLVIGALLIPEGEVVTIEGPDAGGSHYATQLWIAEVDGLRYVRAVNPGAEWLARVRTQPDLDLSSSHGDTTQPQPVRAVIVDDNKLENALNAAMAEKYGVANALVCVFVDTSTVVAVRLDSRSVARASQAAEH